MPELLEVEVYRRAAHRCLGRVVAEVVAPDAWYLKGGIEAWALRAVLVGEPVLDTGRRGKLAWLAMPDHTVGLRFGMTGRIEVDGDAPIAELAYGSARVDPAWVRFELRFADGGRLRIIDPRRLGGVELDPDPDRLGPDAATHQWTPGRLAEALDGDVSLKAALLDQARIAGLGNLLADELLWRSGLDPRRRVRTLGSADWRRVARHLPRTLDELDRRGGSHTGGLQPGRIRGGVCPRDGELLERATVGGRTTYWCPAHQR